MIKSISYSQEEILCSILQLYNKGEPIECDCCYSKGNFYKNKIERPKYCFDICPSVDGVEMADCRSLPFENESISSLIYDPPFLATKGPSLSKNDNNNIINKRFGVYPTESELFEFYFQSIEEFHRILKPNGLLIVKCQDKVSSGLQYLSHVIITNYCENFNFYCEDIFILLSKNRLCAQWQIEHQKRSRKYHSYFLVFRKNNKLLNRVQNHTIFKGQVKNNEFGRAERAD